MNLMSAIWPRLNDSRSIEDKITRLEYDIAELRCEIRAIDNFIKEYIEGRAEVRDLVLDELKKMKDGT